MLVLRRAAEEVITIRDPQGNLLGTVTVCDLDRDRVRLGFVFPRDYRIDRQEIDDRRMAGAEVCTT
jgi:sRNA-binding carbon storage regulator CsrA